MAGHTDTAEEPLMGHQQHHGDEATDDVDLHDVDGLLEKNLKRPGPYVWLLTFTAGISGLLFGCEYLPSPIPKPEVLNMDTDIA